MKNTIMLFLVCLVLSTCKGEQSSSGESLPSVYPKKEWITVEPEQLGYSSKKLEKVKSQFEKTGGVAALVVVNGYIIADWGQTDLNVECRSIRKSLINSLYGIYMEKGKIDYNLSLEEAKINDGAKLTREELATPVKYLMSSSSGIYLPAAFEESVHYNKPPRGSKKPGEFFLYNNWDFNALSTLFNQSTGVDLFEAFDKDIAQPLQMEHFDPNRQTAYVYQPSLSEHPAYLFRISTKDLARYGLLYLNEGKWEDQQIVPKDWVLESTSKQIETGEKFYYNYGYLWWVSKRDNGPGKTPFLARGAQSQYMYVDPNNDLIIIFRDNPDGNQKVKKSAAYPLIGAVYGAMEK